MAVAGGTFSRSSGSMTSSRWILGVLVFNDETILLQPTSNADGRAPERVTPHRDSCEISLVLGDGQNKTLGRQLQRV